MEPKKFEELENLSDLTDETFHALDKKKAFAEIEKKMQELCLKLGKNYSLGFGFFLEISDEEKERSVTLMKNGICSNSGGAPYRVQGTGATSCTYVVKGKIEKMPHDYCPACWGEWDFKLTHMTCPSCGITMGGEIKLLLDTDICPSCEEGKISRASPKCAKCNYVVDTNVVNWG